MHCRDHAVDSLTLRQAESLKYADFSMCCGIMIMTIYHIGVDLKLSDLLVWTAELKQFLEVWWATVSTMNTCAVQKYIIKFSFHKIFILY